MGLSKYQLERVDLLVEIEQGRRVEGELFRESHRKMETMGELLKARMFGSTEYAIGLRKRMTDYNTYNAKDKVPPIRNEYPDPHPEHGVLCDCPDCDEAVKRLLRDCGILPKGLLDYKALTAEPITGRIKVPTRYRRDESDR